MRVIPTFDELEDRALRFGMRAERRTIDKLALECGEQALAHRVVEAITDRAHRRTNAGLLAASAEGDRRVLSGLKESSQHWFVEAIINDPVASLQVFSIQVPFSADHSMSQRLH